MTDAFAISSGISASPLVIMWLPLKMATMLTKQYGAQLNMKAAIANTVMRTNFFMYNFCRSWKLPLAEMSISRLRSNLK